MVQIEQVKGIMEQNLPECWSPLEACLSIIGAATLKDIDHCIGLILVGAPGGRKTTTIGLLGRRDPLIKIDTFTPASFVSHDASKTEASLQKIDLLPQIKHKIMVIPELSPLFTQRYEDLTKDIGILTAVMDGTGFKSASGAHGKRGYDGDYRFGMIAATVPLEHRVWQALGRLSSRWIFYRLEEATGEGFDLRADFGSKKAVCEAVIQPFIKDLWKGFASVPWNRAGDDEFLTDLLTVSAQLICKWRGITVRQDATGYNPALTEVPYRLAETLYALARGHALLWGRTQIETADTFFAMGVNCGNMPEDRAKLFREFMGKGLKNWDEIVAKRLSSADFPATLSQQQAAKILGETFTLSATLSLGEVAEAIGCAPSTASRVLAELTDLEIVERDNNNKGYSWII
ncbi:helix-turn-helix domain-containing protein [Chloroflexota bacterium]